jgi:hypothetical protein
MREITINEWENLWSAITKGEITKKIFPTIKSRIKAHIEHSFMITQFLGGYGRFNSYLERFKIQENTQCLCEKAIETVWHIIFECDMYINRRQPLINEIYRLGMQ